MFDSRFMRIGSFVILMVLFLCFSYSDKHHWDEYYYLYSTQQFTTGELLELEPDLSGGLFPKGFFSTKIAFVAVLDMFSTLPLDGPVYLAIIRFVFALTVIGVAGFTYLLLQELIEKRQAGYIAILCLFTPLSGYFSFKTLTEYSSLLPTIVATYMFLQSFRVDLFRTRILWLLISTVLLCVGVLMRFTSIGFFLSFTGTLFLMGEKDFPRLQVIVKSAACTVLAVAIALLVLVSWVGISVEEVLGSILAVTGREQGIALKVYSLGMIIQFFAPLGLFALWRIRSREFVFATIWFAVSVAPFLLLGNYIEPRYLYLGAVPLAWLLTLGLSRLIQWFFPIETKNTFHRIAFGSVVFVIFLLNQFTLNPLMPYEHSEKEYMKLVDRLEANSAVDNQYVLPWVSDYCLLNLLYPEKCFHLAWSERNGIESSFFEREAFRSWVGENGYLADGNTEFFKTQPTYLLGWKYSQPVLKIKNLLRLLQNDYVEQVEDNEDLKNHLTKSWVWGHPSLLQQPLIERYAGQYLVFDMGLAE